MTTPTKTHQLTPTFAITQLLVGDNYIYVLEGKNQTAVVDPTRAEPVENYLDSTGKKLDLILNTHHHQDHVGGNSELRKRYHCPIYCSTYDFDRVPFATHPLKDGEVLRVAGLEARVIENPGHTLGGISYYFAEIHALFSGDTLFSFGCGRLFEGTPEIMQQSLKKLAKLPPSTQVFCGHEYSLNNLSFALWLTQNAKIEAASSARGGPTVKAAPRAAPAAGDALRLRLKEVQSLRNQGYFVVPTLLGEELALNPFFRALGTPDWAHIRALKDQFRLEDFRDIE